MSVVAPVKLPAANANAATPFHPAVGAWLQSHFGQPTEIQRRAWPVTARHHHALIAAPTGSGKTLAAFLSAINDLVVEGLAHGLADAVQVVYVSPLKALSNDIRNNLQQPLEGIRAQLLAMGLPDPGIRDAVRTGDTPTAQREQMRRRPPHILVTTPESLYILLTSDSGRAMLKSVKSVIVDELHAVAGSKRGSHLMLSLERLEALCQRPLIRIGLSATVKPLDEMARFLIGARSDPVEIIDTGHVRERDVALEMPRSPLGAVMATEVWDELYDRLAELSHQHRTTLIFVNQRRVAERVARHLAERIGEQHVMAHHGSLAREHRLHAEQRLKRGDLKALVATSSLELGIDIGDIDLVCQLGSPRTINALLQRVGRAGHAIGAIPKGRLFPLSLDDLLECTALLDAVRRGELDQIHVPHEPLDALAQQIVAETACREWPLDELYGRCRLAQPYRELTLQTFEQVVQMLAEGYSSRLGRRGAYLHFDAVNRMLRTRRGAKLAAVTNAGVIPDQFDYEVVLLPEGHRVGTLNEDFSFESLPGDIFQLGNTSYRIAKIETGKVLVHDAAGQPPTMPFWLGESLGRSDELSHAVSRLMEAADGRLETGTDACASWLHDQLQLPAAAAQQLAAYLGAAKAALGVLPNQQRIVFERFFDEVGDTHLVIHSPFGSRLNRAWGLALRKRMCRKFNFELQASALEDSIVLSLGPSHSFPLDEVVHYLKSSSAQELLTQALLDAPMFGTRWRWNASASLAVRRMNGGRKVPPQFQRADAQDMLTVIFPDQLACAENIVGEREIPDHPMVQQTLHDCLHETMDVDGLVRLLKRIERGEVTVVTRELTTPSPLSHAILNAKPYAFLDDGAAEERRTKAVATQPTAGFQTAADFGRLDPQAIAAVREQIWPAIESADELHDALVVSGFLSVSEAVGTDALLDTLMLQRRACRSMPGDRCVLVAAERLHEFQALFPGIACEPPIDAVSARIPTPELALREILRSRLDLLGPVDATRLAEPLGLRADAVLPALLALETEGAVMRGSFSAPGADEWCDRRLLARIHRQTRDRRRAAVRAVAPAQFMRFLLRWHQLAASGSDERREGEAGLIDVVRQLEGHAAPAAAWEDDLLAVRIRDYEPAMLDKLCSAGQVAWARLTDTPDTRDTADPASAAMGRKSGPVRGTPIVLTERSTLAHWQQPGRPAENCEAALSGKAARLRKVLHEQGASFFADLHREAGLLGVEAEQALAELVAGGWVTCDSFAGLRALVMPEEKRQKLARRRAGIDPIDAAGRWSLTRRVALTSSPSLGLGAPHVEHVARVLLRRYGVVFRKLIEREDNLPPWRELHDVLRRLEARGEVRGGRFVTGFSGEQFALPEAVTALRKTLPFASQERICLSAVDPLNLLGILIPGDKLPRLSGNRLMFEDGLPIATLCGGEVRFLAAVDAAEQWQISKQLIGSRLCTAPTHNA